MSKFFGFALTTFSRALNLTTGSKKTSFQRVSDGVELEMFRKMFCEREGILLPVDYLSRAVKFFCRNSQGRIVGGFAVVLKGPFRSLDQIPGGFNLPANLKLEEVNGLWLDKSTCVHRRIRFWTFAVGTVLQQKGNAIVYAVGSQKISLRESLFNHIRSWTVYEGPVDNLEGMPHSEVSVEAVEISRKSNLSKQILTYVGIYFSQTAKSAFRRGKQPDFKFRPRSVRGH